jgi:prevent-host-death family protein
MLTASKLRENIYGILDQVLETGTPVEVVRKGKVLRIVPETPAPKLARLKRRKAYKGDADQILGMDWLKEWSELR